jgi:hypothetical protein
MALVILDIDVGYCSGANDRAELIFDNLARNFIFNCRAGATSPTRIAAYGLQPDIVEAWRIGRRP